MSHMQFYFVVSSLKFIGHGNSDNNFESPCIAPSILTPALDGDEWPASALLQGNVPSVRIGEEAVWGSERV
jgi:hypothetical protein